MVQNQNLVSLHPTLDCGHCRLNAICISKNMTEDETAELEKAIVHVDPLKQGDYLFRQGDKFESLYIVRSGSVKSYMTTSDGVEQIVGFNFPGDLLGLDAIEGKYHTTTARALQDSAICKLSWNSFNKLSQKCPHFHNQCLSIFSREIIHVHDLVMAMGQKGVEQKLAIFLLAISQRMKARGFSETEFNLSMSRSDIANFLGVAAETVSREFTQLQKEGIIQVDRRRVQLESLESLKSIAG